MKLLLAVALCLFAAQASAKSLVDYKIERKSLTVPVSPAPWEFGDEDFNGKISNGNQATDTQFPWAVQLRITPVSSSYRCTGSIISSRWIMSAHHCID